MRMTKVAWQTGWMHGLPHMGATLVLLCAGLLTAGCGSHHDDAADEPPLALVGGVAITEADFAFEVQRRVEAGRPLESPQAVLQSLIERAAMLQQAARSPVMEDPVVRRELENQKLVKWLDEALHRERDRVTVSDDELRAGYEANRDDFTRPALTRLAILYRRATPLDPDESQAELKVALEAARARFLDDPAAATRDGRLTGFGVIAAEHSEHTVSRYRGGDLGWLDPARDDHRLPAAITAAGFALAPGEVSDVIEAGDGLYVVMQTDHRAAQVTPFEDAAIGLRRRLIHEKQEAVEQRFRAQLLEQADVAVNHARVEALRLPSGDDRSAAASRGVRPGTESPLGMSHP